MEILPNMEIVDLALYFEDTLVITDVHIGYEEALNRQGVMIPRLQFEDIASRMSNMFKLLKGKRIERVVINGDLKHEFGTISEQEWRNALKFLDLLAKHCSEIILIKGNHDTILGPIARKRNVRVLNYFIVEPAHKGSINGKKSGKNKILVAHGDKVPDKETLKEVSTIIIGHEHPAVSLREGPRVEQFKCFLKGKYKGRNLVVQPSFNTIVEG